jgi:hypothetical protein
MLDLLQSVFSFFWDALKTVGVPIALLVAGGGIARTWQHRNWLTQQRISDQDKVNQETKKLFEDFVDISSKRHFRTKRLYWAICSNDEKKIESERSKYDEILYAWNEAELSWKVRFVKNLSNGRHLNDAIEERIRVPFVNIGSQLEAAIRRMRSAGSAKRATLSFAQSSQIDSTLNGIASSIFEIGREIYGKLDYLSEKRLDNDHIVHQLLAKGRYNELSVSQLFRSTITSSSGHDW